MRRHKHSLIGTGTLSALIITAALVLNARPASAQTKPKPAPAPARPVAPPPQRPVPQRPAPQQPLPQRTQPLQPNSQLPQRPLPNQQLPQRPLPGQQPSQKPLPNQQLPQKPQPNQQLPQKPLPNQPLQPNQPLRPGQPGQPGLSGQPVQPNRAIQPVKPVALPTDTQGHFKPPVNSSTRVLPGGRKETTMSDGTRVQTNAAGKANFIAKPSGAQARLSPVTGKPMVVRHVGPDGTGVVVHNAPSGVKTVNYMKKDASGHVVRVVTRGNVRYQERDLLRRPGYKERTVIVENRTYVNIYHTRTYVRYGAYPVYVPAWYYHPAYYAYFGNPWAASITFGWGSYPGYGSYGVYFAPAGVYASPSAWMADYVIADNLKANYAAQQAADQDSAEPQDGTVAPIPQDVRAAYTQEVQTQIQADQAQASGQPVADSAPGALNPNFRIFQSYSDIEADNGGEQCAITGGDFVRREEETPDANATVAVTVVTIAKPTASHCQANARVRVAVDTLQEWYNGFLESQQQAFEAMAAMQGKNGVPPAPDTLKVANPEGQGTPDDPGVLATAVQEAQTNASSAQAEFQTGGGQ